MTYTCTTIGVNMKKKPLKYSLPQTPALGNLLQDAATAYHINANSFSAEGFGMLNKKLGFSQAEWAAILHISDRTLQRYLKEGKPFSGLQAELLHYLKRLTDTGLQLFESTPSFVQWLRTPKTVLGHSLSFESLKTITGIGLLQQELGRIAYGVYI